VSPPSPSSLGVDEALREHARYGSSHHRPSDQCSSHKSPPQHRSAHKSTIPHGSSSMDIDRRTHSVMGSTPVHHR